MPRKSWWARLPFGVRMTAGVSAVLMVIGGGTAAIAQLTEDEPRLIQQVGDDRAVFAAPPAATPAEPDTTSTSAAPAKPEPVAAAQQQPEADRPRQPAGVAAPVQRKAEPAPPVVKPRAVEPQPVTKVAPRITTRTETERRMIPFRTRLVRDPALPRGAKRIQTPGVPGEELLRYAVTMTDGRPTERRLLDAQVTKQPQHRVVAFGTRRNDCRDDRCGPLWRKSGCEKTTESAAADLGLTVQDLKEVELEPGLLC
ncbi:G5 domain-containing protein [Actinoplanes sp. NPDC089786]|uniref:G5 domain-containing protein n=1 Tax=Actinoplanes sp. NPDC089786 TaxID=3155185 RepID=UPI003437FDF9